MIIKLGTLAFGNTIVSLEIIYSEEEALKDFFLTSRMISKRLIKTVIIALFVCQIVALLIWFFFDENYFIHMLFAPLVGLMFGYKGSKDKE